MNLATVSLDALQAHPQNYRSHPPDQLEHLKQSLREFGWFRNVIASEDGVILAGHGIVEAARAIGLTEAPVHTVPFPHDDPRALKVLAADNESSRLAQDDEGQLLALLELIQAEDSLLGTGFDDDMLATLQRLEAEQDEEEGERVNPYTTKAETPLYEPTMTEAPPVAELTKMDRYNALVAQIDEVDPPTHWRQFLEAAATRHIQFDYAKIAEFYAHAPDFMQRLMEDSALVIIDLDRAIELGYARVRDERLEAVEEARDEWDA